MINSLGAIEQTSDTVILVDERDQILGVCEKLHAHEQALLHRAFSIFIFREHDDKLELLIQQRAWDKYHSGGLWTNSCCGHPRADEQTIHAAERRLQEEMGFSLNLNFVGAFTYKALLPHGLTEYEYDHIFYAVMPSNTVIAYDTQEIADIAWWGINELYEDIKQKPKKYTAWFQQALDITVQHLQTITQLKKYF